MLGVQNGSEEDHFSGLKSHNIEWMFWLSEKRLSQAESLELLMEAVYAVTKLNIKPLLHIALTVLIGFHSMKSAVIPANIESSSVVFFGQNFLFLKRQRLILKFIPLKRSFFNQPTLVSLKNSVSVKWEYFSYFNSNN